MTIKFWHGIAAIGVIWLLLALHRSAVDSSYLTGFADAKADSAQVWAKAIKEQQEQLQTEFKRQLTNANNAVITLRNANREISQREQLLQQEIDYVTTLYRESAAAKLEPLPRCVFTAGFVSVYNGAISPNSAADTTLPAADITAGINRAPSAATVADALQPSNISQRDILHHITGYGSRCQSIEQQLNQLLDYLENINKGAAN